MAENTDWAKTYSDSLEHFLERVKDEVSRAVPSLLAEISNWQEIDDYICNLNTFYYQSFDSHFMPVYRQQIQQLVEDAYNLSRTETMVKKDVMAIIRRYAGLYNKVKTISGLLFNSRREIEVHALTQDRNERITVLHLHNRLEQLLNSLEGLQKLVAPILQLKNNQNYMNAINSSVFCREAARVWSSIPPHDLQAVKDADKCYQVFSLMITMAQDLSQSESIENSVKILEDMRDITSKLAGIRTSELRSWFNDNLKLFLAWNTELIGTFLQQKEMVRAAAAASELQQWLAPLTIVLKQQQTFLSEGQSINPCFDNTAPEITADLAQKLADSQQSLKILLEKLNVHAAGLDSILEQAAEMLDNDFDYYYGLSRRWADLTTGIYLNRICLDLFLIKALVESTRDQHNTFEHLFQHYRELLEWTDKYIQLLGNISSDLERILAPRNLTRIWKGMDIRIEHLILKEGGSFPSDYAYLLDQHQVETRISDCDLIVLHEEGDMFIIRVDDLTEEEMPYLVVGMKG
ncbi:MAG TPA: hypothetical protein VHQ70_10595 [Syntrophomonadaceae bacterium]|nr:hypothetical protein [Syntrophomonadaceae bacterium]